MKQSSTCAWQDRDGKVGRSHCKALKLLPIFHWSPVPVFCDKTVKGLQRRRSLKAQTPKIAAAAAAADMKWFEAGRAAGTAVLSSWRISARGARLVRKQLPWPTFYAPCEVRLWIWFGEIGWAHLFFPFLPHPQTKKNAWRHRLLNTGRWILSTRLQIDILKKGTSVSWREGGGTEVPRGAGGAGGTSLKGINMDSCCFDSRQKEESFFAVGTFQRGHQAFSASTDMVLKSSSCPPRRQHWRNNKKHNSPLVVWVISLPLHLLQAVSSYWPLTRPLTPTRPPLNCFVFFGTILYEAWRWSRWGGNPSSFLSFTAQQCHAIYPVKSLVRENSTGNVERLQWHLVGSCFCFSPFTIEVRVRAKTDVSRKLTGIRLVFYYGVGSVQFRFVQKPSFTFISMESWIAAELVKCTQKHLFSNSSLQTM